MMELFAFVSTAALIIGALGIHVIGREIRRDIRTIRDHQESQAVCAKEQVKITSGFVSQQKWRGGS
jgi:hypothetical protein